jgi:hypothetical protein
MRSSACVTLLGASLLALTLAAHAQLKPPVPSDQPPLGGPVANETVAAKEMAAQAAARRWLEMIDRGDYGRAWNECAELFRERVPRQQWLDSLPATRKPFGAVKSRNVELATYKTTLPGVPDGEYVTVRFGTDFEKKADAEELVSLTFERGAWRPTGYFIR